MFDLMKNTTTKVLLIWCSICQPQKSYTAHNSFEMNTNTNTNTNRKANTFDTESILATHRFMWILTQCQSESIWAALNLERNVPLQCKLHYIHWGEKLPVFSPIVVPLNTWFWCPYSSLSLDPIIGWRSRENYHISYQDGYVGWG